MAGRMLPPAGLSSMGTALTSLRAVDFPKGTILNGLTSQLGIAFKPFLTYCWALHAGTASGCESRLFHLPPFNASGLIAGICKLCRSRQPWRVSAACVCLCTLPEGLVESKSITKTPQITQQLSFWNRGSAGGNGCQAETFLLLFRAGKDLAGTRGPV